MEREDDKMPEMRQTAVRLTGDDDAARPQKTPNTSWEIRWVVDGGCGKCGKITGDWRANGKPQTRCEAATESQCHMDSTYFDMLFI